MAIPLELRWDGEVAAQSPFLYGETGEASIPISLWSSGMGDHLHSDRMQRWPSLMPLQT